MLEDILLPAVKDLAFEISRFATQSDMMQRFSFDKIILSGILLETNISNYKFLERIVIDYISKAMDINTDLISPSKHNGREALLGAALYGNRPEDFTERIARVSYAVNIRAFGIKEFEDKTKSKIEEEKKNSKDEDDLKNRIYSLESQNSYASDEKVELFYQPYLDTSTFNCGEDDLSYIIRRGDKILEKHQSEGILKKFYARENCIVYASK
ncbi:hypothetical protein BDF21DRAFT_161924 [Thamnidium elegans]|nr:hypothetical protein BDF21DRAFT_161924 [Thamnidium elegans]